jgi:flagellar hook assembly protein FlgD
MASASSVKIDIYDIRGRLVDTIFNGFAQAGHNSVIWNADNYGSGVYFSRVQAGDSFDTRKLVLLK